jgi:chemotaxis signal transduction protein
MTTMVCFSCAGADYCVSVQATRAVRRTSGMIALPFSGVDVAGVLPGDPPLTVVSPLGATGTQVLILEAGGAVFGLLVDAVTGLRRIVETEISAPPAGQRHPFVIGTVQSGGRLVLVTDPEVLAVRLCASGRL